jgi:hypothetical protein
VFSITKTNKKSGGNCSFSNNSLLQLSLNSEHCHENPIIRNTTPNPFHLHTEVSLLIYLFIFFFYIGINIHLSYIYNKLCCGFMLLGKRGPEGEERGYGARA